MVHVHFRRLAVPLLLVLLLPSVVSNPQPTPWVTETLVEGHTVFTFLTATDPVRTAGAPVMTAAHTPSASADEGAAPASIDRLERSPGVLWTNHQFLVEPVSRFESRSLPAGAVGTEQSRTHFAASLMALVHRSHGSFDVTTPCGGALLAVSEGYPDPRSGDVGSVVMAANVGPVSLGYRESYLVTDPNDHLWVTDMYDARTTLTLDGLTTEHTWPVWVTNVLGSPVFVPDFEGPCAAPYPDLPAAGYAEPSTNGYCFDARQHTGDCADDSTPRVYNGVFYFRWEDLTQAGTPRSHTDAFGSPDVHACDAYSIWPCPDGDDDAEGASHAFHPDPWGESVEEAPSCPDEANTEASATANHGGSTTAESSLWYDGMPRDTSTGACDELHATRRVDIYYDPQWRPQEPLVRRFAVQDLSGDEARFGQA